MTIEPTKPMDGGDGLRATQLATLGLIAEGAPLEEVLTELCLGVERLAEGVLVSVLVCDDDGRRLRHAAAPSLPNEYTRAVDGIDIGPAVGSCGTAAHRGETVVVADIASDPLWADFCELARRHGLASCWSVPILAEEQQVLGTLAVYRAEARGPDARELRLTEEAARLARIAIERHREEGRHAAALADAEAARVEAEILLDVGQRLAAELDLERLVQAATDAATTLTGAEFGAFFYNTVDRRGESYLLYALSGAPREAFADFPMPRNTSVFGTTFRGEGVVRLDDVTADPRYGRNPPYLGMPSGHLPVRSYLAVPVVAAHGEVLGGLFFGHQAVGVFSERAERLAAGIAGYAAVAIENARLVRTAHEATARAETIARNAASCLFMVDGEGRATFMNEAAERVTGFRLEELADVPLHDGIHRRRPDGTPFPIEECPIADARRSREPVRELADTFMRKDGSLFPVVCSFSPIEQDGHITGGVLEFRDVTAEREAEAALRASEERFRLLLASSTQTVWTAGPDGAMNARSESWEAFTGQAPDEYLGPRWGWLDAIHPDDRDAAAAGWRSVLAEPRPITATYRLRRYDGVYRRVVGHAAPVLDEQGGASEWIGSNTDVEDQRRAAEELAYQGQLMQTITDNAAGALLMMDARGHPTFMNPAAEAMTGFRLEDIRDRPLHEAIHHTRPNGSPYPIEECPIDRALPEGRTVTSYEETFVNRDGAFFPVLVSASPIVRDGRPVGTVIDVRDLTEQKRAEIALREADRQKDEFIATLAHELRNPLAPILNAAELLRRAPGDTAATTRAAEMIARQAGHMARLVDDLLDISRIVRGKITLQRRPVELNELVRATTLDHRMALEKASLTLKVELPGERVVVDGDPTRLAQMLTNLLTNAEKFTDPGGEVRVTLEVDRATERAVLTVVDSGIGMSADILERLFSPFAREDVSRSRNRGGLGLGLAVTRGLAELHGGSIDAASDGPGKGSRFTVVLPLAHAAEIEPAREARGAASAERMSVLIVEDNRDVAEALAMLLDDMGHAVETAFSGSEGIEVGRQLCPALVLCDLGLPGGLDGHEVARALRADPGTSGAYLVALTGYGQQEDRRRALEAGFDEHLTKPLSLDSLEALLVRVAARGGIFPLAG